MPHDTCKYEAVIAAMQEQTKLLPKIADAVCGPADGSRPGLNERVNVIESCLDTYNKARARTRRVFIGILSTITAGIIIGVIVGCISGTIKF